jgi:hypothetical protein
VTVLPDTSDRSGEEKRREQAGSAQAGRQRQGPDHRRHHAPLLARRERSERCERVFIHRPAGAEAGRQLLCGMHRIEVILIDREYKREE